MRREEREQDTVAQPGVLYRALTAPAGYTVYYAVDSDERLVFETTVATALITRELYDAIEAMAKAFAPSISLVR